MATLSYIDLKKIAAPMVNQSDLPFRILVRRYGATAAYTQMYNPHSLLNDQQYLEYHIRDLAGSGISDLGNLERPVVAQLCGNDPDTIVQAGRKLQGYCDAIGEGWTRKKKLYVFVMTTNDRSQSGMSSRCSQRRSLWCLPTWTKRLAIDSKSWCVYSCQARSKLKGRKSFCHVTFI